MADVFRGEAQADDLQHLDELAEHEHLVPLVAQLLEPLQQRLELGARQIAMRGVDERGMAANLAQAEEARKDVEAHGGERVRRIDAEELGARALEFGIVERALLALELDDKIVLGARRQLGCGLGLGATEEEVAHAAVQARVGLGIDVGVVPAKCRLRPEQTGLRKREEAPQIREAILDRRAGEDEAMLAREAARDGRDLAARVLDELAFVEDDDVPRLRLEPNGVEAELGVVRDEEVGIERGGRGSRAEAKRIEGGGLERGREALGLDEPAMRDALGADDEQADRRRIGRARLREVQEPREGLHGFAEAHVVGEDAAEPERGMVREEMKPLLLVGPQRGAQAGGERRRGL